MKKHFSNSFDFKKDENLLRGLFQELGEPCVKAILMFGSRARGETRAGSDIDLLVLHDDCGIEDPVKRRSYLYDILRNVIGTVFEAVTVIDMESNHFLKPKEISSLLLNIYWDGIVVYDKIGVLETFLADVKEKIAKSGLERIRDGKAYYWILPIPVKEVRIL